MKLSERRVPSSGDLGPFYILEVSLDDPHVDMSLGSTTPKVSIFNPRIDDLRAARVELTKLIEHMVHMPKGRER